jgi:hypothetical protein
MIKNPLRLDMALFLLLTLGYDPWQKAVADRSSLLGHTYLANESGEREIQCRRIAMDLLDQVILVGIETQLEKSLWFG